MPIFPCICDPFGHHFLPLRIRCRLWCLLSGKDLTTQAAQVQRFNAMFGSNFTTVEDLVNYAPEEHIAAFLPSIPGARCGCK